MSKPLKKISLKNPTLEEDKLVTTAAESDPDALSLTDDQMSTMHPCAWYAVDQSWQIKSSWLQYDIVLKLLAI
jgi:hypothetical protein